MNKTKKNILWVFLFLFFFNFLFFYILEETLSMCSTVLILILW